MVGTAFVAAFAVSALVSGLGTMITTYLACKLSAFVLEKVKQGPLRSNRAESETRKERANSASSASYSGSTRYRSRSRSIEEYRTQVSVTLATSAFLCWIFSLYLFLRSALSAAVFIQMVHSRVAFHRIQNKRYYKIMTSITLFILVVCYGLMSWNVFQKLVEVFADSSYRLSVGTVRFFQWSSGLSSLSAIVGFVCFFWFKDIPVGPLIIPGILTYPLTLMYSTYRFIHTTQKISGSMIPKITTSNSSSSISSMNKSVVLSAQNLMNGSLRLAIVTVAVILSSVLMLSVSFVHGATQDPTVLLFLHVISALDICCNTYCLLCSYSRFEKEYMCLLGLIHAYWMNRLSPQY